MTWFLLFVKPDTETSAQNWIKRFFSDMEVKCIVPKRRLTERRKEQTYEVIRLVFPGYIFIKANMTKDFHSKLSNMPYLKYMLGDFYTKISQEEMSVILTLIGDGEIVDYSVLFIEDRKPHVISGPLKGLESTIAKVDKRRGRAKVCLGFLGSTQKIDMGVKVLIKAQ